MSQNLIVKKFGSLKKLEEIAWGHSGKRFRAKPELREGLLSVEDQVSVHQRVASPAMHLLHRRANALRFELLSTCIREVACLGLDLVFHPQK